MDTVCAVCAVCCMCCTDGDVTHKISFPRKSCRLGDNVEKYGTAGQATDDNMIRRMRFECWITKTTNAHS